MFKTRAKMLYQPWEIALGETKKGPAIKVDIRILLFYRH